MVLLFVLACELTDTNNNDRYAPTKPPRFPQMDKLIIPASEPNPQRFSTVQEVCAKLQGGKKTTYDVVRGPGMFTGLDSGNGDSYFAHVSNHTDPLPRGFR